MTDQSTGRRDELGDHLSQVRRRIEAACGRADRDPAELTLVVVTKFFPASDVALLADLGVRDIGENRDQEAGEKVADLPDGIRERLRVHFIGQLQSNKAGHVARYADVVQSVDRPKIVHALQRGADAAGRTIDALVQVDLSGDDAGRGGVAPAALDDLVAAFADAPALRLRGVMAVAPLHGDPLHAFTRLRELSAQVRMTSADALWISAGMSGDLEQAIQCGATHLRVGSAILGSRPAQR